MNLQISAI